MRTHVSLLLVTALSASIAAPLASALAQSSTVITSPALGGGSNPPPSSTTPYGSPTPIAPPPGATQAPYGSAPQAPPVTSAPIETLPTDPTARALVRVQQLESQINSLTGRLEEVQFQNSQLQQRVDRLQKDVDLRFKELEEKAAQPAAEAAPAGGGAAASAAAEPAGAVGSSDGGQPAANLKSPAGATAKTGAAEAPKSTGSAQDQYEQAFALLRSGDNAGAEKALAAFIAAHPTDALAGNAQYWIGQSQFSRGEYERAAVSFLQGYQKYPKSAKGADTMLGLGLSLSQAGKKKEACAAFGKLNADFPNAADYVKRKASAERQKLGC